jgi:hypothetical protein
MYIEEAYEADISGDIPVTALNKTKSKDLDQINGKTPLILERFLEERTSSLTDCLMSRMALIM